GGSDISYKGNMYHSPVPQEKWFHVDGRHINLAQWSTETGATDEVSGRAAFVDPSRDVTGYNQLTGGGGTSFTERARSLNRGNWDSRLTGHAASDWIRQGYS